MKKRDFLRNVGYTTFGIMGARLLNASGSKVFDIPAGEIHSSGGKFELPKLPYEYNALEPVIDAQTMEIHYSKHHKGYVDNLNKAIADKAQQNWTLEKICANASASDAAVRNNAGGHYNHTMFWQWLTPQKAELKDGALKTALINNFGSVEKFKEKFTDAAKKQFGSGWAWLVRGANGKLYVYATPNQDNPIMRKLGYKGEPLLGLDVWEHAYYLKYQNKRADYVENFWNVVNWDRVAALYGK